MKTEVILETTQDEGQGEKNKEKQEWEQTFYTFWIKKKIQAWSARCMSKTKIGR